MELSRVRGTGSEGEILAEDILAFVAAGSSAVSGAAAPAQNVNPPAEAGATSPLSQVARLMAERTTQSWTTAPHFFVTREIDASALLAAREKLGPSVEKEFAVKLSHTDLLVAAVARALAKHPLLNASWTGSAIRLNPDINVGIAMAVESGVVTASIPAANTKKLGEIAVAAPRTYRTGPRGEVAPRGHHRRDLHDQQPGHVPGGFLHRDYRATAGRHPGRGAHRGPRCAVGRQARRFGP